MRKRVAERYYVETSQVLLIYKGNDQFMQGRY